MDAPPDIDHQIRICAADGGYYRLDSRRVRDSQFSLAQNVSPIVLITFLFCE